MRSAEVLVRGVLPMVLAATLAGCAATGESLKAIRDAVTSSSSSSSGSGSSTVATAKAAVPARPVAAQSDAPVSPAAQRAFDDAARALRAGRAADAERGFRAVADASPELGGPHANLGLIYRQAGKLPESAGELERAVKLNPKQPLYLNQLAITYRQQGQFVKAREAYETAMALDPGYAAPVLNLGILNDLYLGDARRALELYDRYLAMQPSGDAAVTKWVADLKNRKPAPITVSRREKE